MVHFKTKTGLWLPKLSISWQNGTIQVQNGFYGKLGHRKVQPSILKTNGTIWNKLGLVGWLESANNFNGTQNCSSALNSMLAENNMTHSSDSVFLDRFSQCALMKLWVLCIRVANRIRQKWMKTWRQFPNAKYTQGDIQKWLISALKGFAAGKRN